MNLLGVFAFGLATLVLMSAPALSAPTPEPEADADLPQMSIVEVNLAAGLLWNPNCPQPDCPPILHCMAGYKNGEDGCPICECATGLQIMEGDIVVDVKDIPDEDNRGLRRTGLWTKNGDTVTIPYSTDSTIGGSVKAMAAITAAMEDFHKYTCIRLVRRSSQRAYLHFRNGGGCSSPVGMTGRQNTITLASECWYKSYVLHEMMHSLGFHHEHTRPDRDGYVRIRWENIPDNIEYNFKKQSRDRVDSRGSPYDYLSIMHYGKTAFGSGKVTMETTNRYFTDEIGQNVGFSPLDVEQINLAYGCPKYNGELDIPRAICRDKHEICKEHKNECQSSSFWRNNCPYTCKMPCDALKPAPTQGLTQGPIPPPTKSNCRDLHTNCRQFKSYCRVSHWVSHMKKNCTRTCSYC